MGSPDEDQNKTRPGTPRPQPPAPAPVNPVDPDATQIPPPKQPAPAVEQVAEQDTTRINQPVPTPPTPPPAPVSDSDATRINQPVPTPPAPPAAAPPSAPPPSAPTPSVPPAPPVAQPPSQWPQTAGAPPMPPGGPYVAYGQTPGGPQQKKGKGLLIGLIAGAAALVLVIAGLGIAFATGHLGFGPLSGKDKSAAKVIAREADRPDWATSKDASCAADGLLHKQRSKKLQKSGLIKPSGKSWTYTGRWSSEVATTYADQMLGCKDDWSSAVGKSWGLTDTKCLKKVDQSDMAGLVAKQSLKVAGAESGKATDTLDHCYASDLSKPTATAAPDVLGVNFTVTAPTSGSDMKLSVTSDDGAEVSGSGSAYHVNVEEGGQKSCITMSASVSYPWGTTKTSEGNACGTAKAKRLWWVKMPKCNQPGIPCFTWELHYEGFKLFEPYPLKLAQKGGDCHSASGRCSQTIYATAKTGTWAEWTAPKNWHDPFTATVDGVTAKIPN